jgi:hypothetical protein
LIFFKIIALKSASLMGWKRNLYQYFPHLFSRFCKIQRNRSGKNTAGYYYWCIKTETPMYRPYLIASYNMFKVSLFITLYTHCS